MKGEFSMPVLMILVILIGMLFGIGVYLILFKGSAGELISWVSPFAHGIPDAFG